MNQSNSNELRFYNQIRLCDSSQLKLFLAYNEKYADIMKEFKENNFYDLNGILDKYDDLNSEVMQSFKKVGLFVKVPKGDYFDAYNDIKANYFIAKESNFYELCFAFSSIIFIYESYGNHKLIFRKWVAKGLIYSILYFMNNQYENNEIINAALDKHQVILN